ncbi:MAG: hypothetical protein ACHP85_02060, partial [Burkholderiales bacterium]
MHFGVHVRFLLAVPALILGEAMAHRVSTTLIPYFLTSGVVPPAQRGAFVRVVGSVARLRDRALPWLLIAVVVIAWTILQPLAVGSDAGHEAKWASEGGGLGFGGWWFLYVSRPIFSVLLAAWLWRLALVFVLLKRIAGLDLSIVPTHPDGAGGLGFVKDLPKAFSLLAFATSAVVASRLAHDVMYHDVSLLSLKVVLGGFVVMVIAVCVAPLLALARPLAAAKRRALLEYGALVGKHGRLVRQRWILGETLVDDGLIQAAEIGPVADTLALYDAVRRMQAVPFGKSTLIGIAVPTLVPILVLLSTQVPIKEVLKKIIGALLVILTGVCRAPLPPHARPLAAAKRKALLEYGALVGKHGRLVRQRWILGETLADDGLIQAAEIGPVADTLALYDAVRRMQA